ncbi:MAG: hypothetical protein ACRCUS_05450, partial [Anaerovoracaceae bacterium]
FIIGVYCTKEHVQKIQAVKKWKIAILGICLIFVSIILAYYVPVSSSFYLLKTWHGELGITWWGDILLRIVDFILPCLWIIFFLNVMPRKSSYLTYVGMNTMAVYILHLIVRYIVREYDIIPTNNQWVYYISIFALASLCVVVFASPLVSNGYNAFFDFLYEKPYLSIRAFVYKICKEPINKETMPNKENLGTDNYLKIIGNKLSFADKKWGAGSLASVFAVFAFAWIITINKFCLGDFILSNIGIETWAYYSQNVWWFSFEKLTNLGGGVCAEPIAFHIGNLFSLILAAAAIILAVLRKDDYGAREGKLAAVSFVPIALLWSLFQYFLT